MKMAITQLLYLAKPKWFNLDNWGFILCLCLIVGTGLVAYGQKSERFTFDHRQMGTQFRIILYASDSADAKMAAMAAFKEIDRLNAIFSDYMEESELSQLASQAGKGKWIPIGPDMWTVLRQAQLISRKSKGAFDITVGPLSKLWRRAFRQQEFPKTKQLFAAQQLVNYRKLKISRKEAKVRLQLEGMRLDAGGIAKGYALDRAMAVLKSFGIKQALVDGGGDILVSDPPPGQNGWLFQTKLVDNKRQLKEASLTFQNCAVATSGDTYRYLEWEGKRFSHIIDPRDGLGVSHGALVSVQAPSGMLADALASALSVLGPHDGKRLIRKFKNCQAQIIFSNGVGIIQHGKLNSIRLLDIRH